MQSFDEYLKRPTVVALIYFLFGVSWIVVTDLLTISLVDNPDSIALLQTAKGWVFVGLSSVVVFGLVNANSSQLRQTNHHLDQALQQLSVLHRLLRHNLRNHCNVIRGNAELLDDTLDNDSEALEAIMHQTDQLADLSEKSHYLRDLVLTETPPPEEPVREVLLDVADEMRTRYPESTIDTDLSPAVTAEVSRQFNRGIAELVENAIEHVNHEGATVRIGLRPHPTQACEITIADDGPGMPSIERDVLERGVETPMFHSQGVGLWIAKTVVDEHGGRFRIYDPDSGGTIVAITLPQD